MKKSAELCGIEFRDRKGLQRFQLLNPMLCDAVVLEAGERRLLVFRTSNFPTRDIQEIFTKSGKHYATFIGPDALEGTYQVKIRAPGEQGGHQPEAFR